MSKNFVIIKICYNYIDTTKNIAYNIYVNENRQPFGCLKEDYLSSFLWLLWCSPVLSTTFLFANNALTSLKAVITIIVLAIATIINSNINNIVTKREKGFLITLLLSYKIRSICFKQ